MSLERTGPTRVVQSSEHLDLSLNWSAKFKEVDYYVFKGKIQKQSFRKIGQANSKKKKKNKSLFLRGIVRSSFDFPRNFLIKIY